MPAPSNTAWIVSLIAVGCAIVDPLDSVTPSSSPACADCSDAAADASHATPRVQREPSRPADSSNPFDDDGGTSDESRTVACFVPAGAECNPLTNCGCLAGTRCGLDESRQSVRCLDAAGSAQLGQACAETRECASSLACSPFGSCSRYCLMDSDCDRSGLCWPFGTPGGMKISGAAWCTRRCDPISGEPCLSGTVCTAAQPGDPELHAFCEVIRGPNGGRARGEACTTRMECAAGLACSTYGPRVCTRYCRTNSDCPADAPHCHVADFQAAPGDPVGQCVIWPCDDSTLPNPQSWTGPAVWTQEALQDCERICAGIGLTCYRDICPGGETWYDCMWAELARCAGAKGGPCRSEYIAATCCDASDCRTGGEFERCAEADTGCKAAAERVCTYAP